MKDRIEFDRQDQNLFEISDLRLRADALKNSVLPRLQALMHICIDMVRDVYGIEVLDDSILSLSPNFRMRREREIQVDYQWASVSLGGQRKKGMWPGLIRDDGRQTQIIPYLFGFWLTRDGIGFQLVSHLAKGFSDGPRRGLRITQNKDKQRVVQIRLANGSKRGLVIALQRHGALIAELCRLADIPWLIPVMPEELRLQRQLDADDFAVEYVGETLPYPVTEEQVRDLSFRFVSFYPVYDLCICYAKGEPDRFDEMIGRLNEWILSMPDDDEGAGATGKKADNTLGEEAAANAALRRIRVMPALRWQVFQRDSWKCVACGKTSHDGVLLHVDHIRPRSKGGKDGLDNLQTLCSECNIGKGNRDMTNLRLRSQE